MLFPVFASDKMFVQLSFPDNLNQAKPSSVGWFLSRLVKVFGTLVIYEIDINPSGPVICGKTLLGNVPAIEDNFCASDFFCSAGISTNLH